MKTGSKYNALSNKWQQIDTEENNNTDPNNFSEQQQAVTPTPTPTIPPKNSVLYNKTTTNTGGTTTEKDVSNGYKTNHQTVTYDYPKADDEGNKEKQTYLDKYGNKARENFNSHIAYLQNLYQQIPDTATPLRDDLKNANWQMFATALSDLGKAAGKAAGNNGGRGMVQVDNDKKFQDDRNRAYQLQAQLRQAEKEDALRKIQQELNIENEKYQGDNDLLGKEYSAYNTGRNRSLENNKDIRQDINDNVTTTKTTNGHNTSETWLDKNSQQWKNMQLEQAQKRAEINHLYQKTYNSSSNLDLKDLKKAQEQRHNGELINIPNCHEIPNFFYGAKGKKNGYYLKGYNYKNKPTSQQIAFANAMSEKQYLQLTDDEINKLYSRMLPAISAYYNKQKGNNSNSLYTVATNPQEKAKAIAFLLNNKSNLSTGYGFKKDNTDLRQGDVDEIYNSALNDIGVYRDYDNYFNQ
jgi:hypothetical protein